MATTDDLCNDLCATMPSPDDSLDAAATEDGLALPAGLLTTALQAWILKQVKDLTCKERDTIEDAIEAFIVKRIPNPQLATFVSLMASAALEYACPSVS